MRVRGCALIEQAGKILVLAYDYPGGRVFGIPGGGLKDGETLVEGIVREYQEELGLTVEVGQLRYVGDMMAQPDGLKQTVHVVFEGRIVAGTPVLNPAETTAAEVRWLDYSELGEVRLYPAINEALMADRTEGFAPRYLGNCLSREWA